MSSELSCLQLMVIPADGAANRAPRVGFCIVPAAARAMLLQEESTALRQLRLSAALPLQSLLWSQRFRRAHEAHQVNMTATRLGVKVYEAEQEAKKAKEERQALVGTNEKQRKSQESLNKRISYLEEKNALLRQRAVSAKAKAKASGQRQTGEVVTGLWRERQQCDVLQQQVSAIDWLRRLNGWRMYSINRRSTMQSCSSRQRQKHS